MIRNLSFRRRGRSRSRGRHRNEADETEGAPHTPRRLGRLSQFGLYGSGTPRNMAPSSPQHFESEQNENEYDIVPLDFPRQRDRTFTSETWWIVDLSHQPPLRDGATPLVARCMKAYGWSEASARRVLNCYHQFWQLKIEHQDWYDTIISPSYAIDQIWQQHILDVVGYVEDSMHFCGHVVLRKPQSENANDSINALNASSLLMEKREKTKEALEDYVARNNIILDEFVWFEVVHCDRPRLSRWRHDLKYEKTVMGATKLQRNFMDIFDRVVNDSSPLFACHAPKCNSMSVVSDLETKEDKQSLSSAGNSGENSIAMRDRLQEDDLSVRSVTGDFSKFLDDEEDNNAVAQNHSVYGQALFDGSHFRDNGDSSLSWNPRPTSNLPIPPPPLTSLPRQTRSLFDTQSMLSGVSPKSCSQYDNSQVPTTHTAWSWRRLGVKPALSTRSQKTNQEGDGKSATSTKSRRGRRLFGRKSSKNREDGVLKENKSMVTDAKSQLSQSYYEDWRPVSTKSKKSEIFIESDSPPTTSKSRRSITFFDEQSFPSQRSPEVEEDKEEEDNATLDEIMSQFKLQSPHFNKRDESDQYQSVAGQEAEDESGHDKSYLPQRSRPRSKRDYEQENWTPLSPPRVDTTLSDGLRSFPSSKSRDNGGHRRPFSPSVQSLPANPSNVTDASNMPKLTIRLRDDEEIHYLKISYAARMGKVFEAYANRKGVPVDTLRFFTPDGDVIGYDTEGTPAYYGLADQDEILVSNMDEAMNLQYLWNKHDSNELEL